MVSKAESEMCKMCLEYGENELQGLRVAVIILILFR